MILDLSFRSVVLVIPIGLLKANPREVVQLKRALHAASAIKAICQKTDNQSLNLIAEQINHCQIIREKIEKYLSGSGEMYSVLRARIRSVNGRSLVEHLGTPNPTGEFTREFNITTTPLDNEILE